MLFHVTISHTKQDCPGHRPDDPLALVTPSEHLDALGEDLAVHSHYVLFGAACIMWSEPEHVAYALLEAPNVDAAVRYVRELTPAGWQVRTLPVFRLPDQLPLVRHVLGAPVASPVEEPVAESPADDQQTPPALAPLQVTSQVEAAPAPSEPPKPTTRPTVPSMPAIEPAEPLPAPPAPRPSDAVTRIVERPVFMPREADEDRASTLPPGRSDASITDLLESIDTSNEQSPSSGGSQVTKETPSSGEVQTLILAPHVAGKQQLRLLAVAGPSKNAVFEVGEEGGTIGRLPENQIHLSDGRLSRLHARLEFQDGAFWIRDLGSANGTLVNGEMLSGAQRLTPGDSIEVGTSLLTVIDEPESSA
ncbi:MAG TPA: FHA domain-containing protein [Chloroflexota bacterium]|jgi:hypothetical protein|nr:FHA domain-containing protein [Chloroflexota bacterium]